MIKNYSSEKKNEILKKNIYISKERKMEKKNTLADLADPSRTDKNTTHSYLNLYEKLLSKRRENAKNLLEVGIWMGGSTKLWRDYFTRAEIHVLDIDPIEKIWDGIKNDKRIIIHASTDAYNENVFIKKFGDKFGTFDIVIDDGPHTLDSMIKFLQLYPKLLNDKGILIIEDIQYIDWIEQLKNHVPEELKPYIRVYDLRNNKGRYDDIVLVIDKDTPK